jgi:phosphoglycerate dehydrogenase-like enzyme
VGRADGLVSPSVAEPVPVVVGPLGESGIGAAFAEVDGIVPTMAGDFDEVIAALEQAEVLVTYLWSDDWLDSALHWVQSVSVGTDQFPVEAMAERGVVLTSAHGIHEVQVAEHALAALLAMTRGIATAVRQQEKRIWQWPPVFELDGMTLGILGLGHIGEGVARRASALGMHVIGTKRNPGGYDGAAAEVFSPSGTLEVCRRSDAVIVTLPLTRETERIVGRPELEALEGGWLVNVGRGPVIDHDALAGFMQQGLLRGAALDVFEVEPLPLDSPLWSLPNVLITPHLAGHSPRYGEKLASVFSRNLAAFKGESDWINRVV